LELVRLDTIQPQKIDCPVKGLFLPQLPDKLGQEKYSVFFVIVLLQKITFRLSQ
jgi:hypothetical protein